MAIGVENHPDMRHKDTGHNVRVTEEFTVNIAKDALVDQQNRLHRREADRPRVTQRQFLHRGREESRSGGQGSTHHHRRLVASRPLGGIGAGVD